MSLEEPAIEMAPGPPPMPAGEPPPPKPGFSGPMSLVFAGMLCLSMAAYFETKWSDEQPWSNAILMLGKSSLFPVPPDDAHGVWARTVSRRVPAAEDALFESLNGLARNEGIDLSLSQPERVIAVELPVGEMGVLLLSGRLPEPGKPEVLAGDLARDDPFELDGVEFQVVGRMKRGVSGFLFTYLLPYAPGIASHFKDSTEVQRGWIHLNGLAVLDELRSGQEQEEAEFIGGQTRTQDAFAAFAIFGLVLVAAGGAKLYMRLFERMSEPPTPVLGPLLRETVQRPRLFRTTHAVLYGVFFVFMTIGIEWPLLNYRLTEYMTAVFSEGGLSYIGDAYASQNILQAAIATYHNNYVVQTLGYTFLISVPPLALGVLKTVASFALVGFAMTPIWAGAASGYVFHSITMALELEAYIVACFVVMVWPIHLWRGINGKGFGRELFLGVRIFIGGIILTGVMLAIAALYEAASLILMGHHV